MESSTIELFEKPISGFASFSGGTKSKHATLIEFTSKKQKKISKNPLELWQRVNVFMITALYEQRKFSLAVADACLINSQKDSLVPVSSDTSTMTSFVSLSFAPAHVESCI